jgi:hypothetical protein
MPTGRNNVYHGSTVEHGIHKKWEQHLHMGMTIQVGKIMFKERMESINTCMYFFLFEETTLKN